MSNVSQVNVSVSPWTKKETGWILFVVSVIVLTGVFGNLLVITVTLMNAVFKTTANALIVNLAVTDILTLCSLSIMIFTLNQGNWTHGNTVCQVNGLTTMTFSLASALSISAISINRYIFTVHTATYPSIFGPRRRTVFLLVFLWVFSGTFGSLPILGWSKYEYFPSRGFCFWSCTTSLSYTITYYCLVTPCCLSAVYCYWRIYLTIRKNAPNQVVSWSTITDRSAIKMKKLQDHSAEVNERKITLSICVVVLVYYTTLTPFTVVNLMVVWRPGFVISPALDICTTIIALTNYALNVFIYAISIRRYRLAIRKLFKKLRDFFWSNKTRVRRISDPNRRIEKRQKSWF